MPLTSVPAFAPRPHRRLLTFGWTCHSDLYGGGNSAVTSVADDFNAFDARDALYSIQCVLPRAHGAHPRVQLADSSLFWVGII